MRLVLIAFLIVFSFFSLLWLVVVIAALSGEDDDLHTYEARLIEGKSAD